MLLRQQQLGEAGAGSLGQGGRRVQIGVLERARPVVGDHQDVCQRAPGMDHRCHQSRLRAGLEPARQRELARLCGAQGHRRAGAERLGQRRRLIQAEPVALRGMRVPGHNCRAP